jgi:hypothetical protein
MKILSILLSITLTFSFLPDIDINGEVNDYYLIEENMKPWFGKKHLQKNNERTIVS